jgi:hypothetical protein
MARNVGNSDRIFRVIGALPLLVCAFLAPLPLTARLAAFALPGGYLLFTALSGVCFGYLLMGESTCATPKG